ncbi:MAG: glycosyltransferase family 2 protein [Kiritimatiellae bacterium]|nr:glycosyltransferase family 2 protein [Kiritimatiellia bacterium]
MDLSVVIPVFNEEENVPLLAKALDDVLRPLDTSYEVILVDDGSNDGSWDAMLKATKDFCHFKLIRLRRNFGQTPAMSAGLTASRGETIITLDADLQNDPADIPKLLDKISEGFDVVSGWRKNRKDTFINRRLPSILGNALISKITGVFLHDYGCTLKAYRRDIIENIKLYGEMHRFIPAIASWVGGRLTEIEVNHNPRRFGKSKYGISRTTKVILDLLTVKFLLRYSTHPMQVFGKMGMGFGIPGVMMTVLFLFAHFSYNFMGLECMGGLVEMSKRPAWVITPLMLILFCMQFISMGLLAELQIRTYHESQNKPTYVIKEIVDSHV